MKFGMLALVALLLAGGARAQTVPLGGQFQVNTYTTGNQRPPAVAADQNGGLIVVWGSDFGDGTDDDFSSIQVQRYGATGHIGGQLQANVYTPNQQEYPTVASDAAGNFVVVWEGYGGAGSDTDSRSIQARRYDATAAPLGGEFQVNTYTTGFQFRPSVASDAAGNFVVVWESNGSAGSDSEVVSIQAQRYDANGTPQGGQFQVNSYTTSFQNAPDVALGGGGDFVVVWMSLGSAGSDSDFVSIQAQRYNANGTPQGSEFQVNTYTTSFQASPDVALNGDGNFVVVWQSYGSAGSDSDSASIQAQRYDASGTPQGSQFQVNTYTTAGQSGPDVALDGGGNFVVVWESNGSAGSDSDSASIQAQRYNANGTPQSSQFQVNTYTTDVQYRTALAGDNAGNFVVAWRSFGSAGSDTDESSVQAQRFAAGRAVRGLRMILKDPLELEELRTVTAIGKETATDIGPAVVGDPTASGATLRIIAKGTDDSDETYLLGAGGWRRVGTVGFEYAGPTGGDGDPVKKVLLTRSSGGTAVLKVLLKGNVGTQPVNIQPPNSGDEGGIILTFPGGGTYCAAFGGAAGGTETTDHGRLWKVVNASADGCPTP